MSRHTRLTLRVLAETAALLLGLALLANWLGPQWGAQPALRLPYLLVWLAQGLALQRVYVVAHEASHYRLGSPDGRRSRRRLNDLLGQTVLLPMLVPLEVLRTIHYFHHGFNRRDARTSSLDVLLSPWPVTPLVRLGAWLVWFAGVFAGGLFLHSLVSIVLFLCLPLPLARRVSPAFRQWDGGKLRRAWGQFLACLTLHAAVWLAWGPTAWLFSLGLPLLAFAWVWSLIEYIFHYDTTLGEASRYHVRSVRLGALGRWWLLDFNEHTTHHLYPNLPWYELRHRRAALPPQYATRNQDAASLMRAVLAQLKGPQVIYARDPAALGALLTPFDGPPS